MDNSTQGKIRDWQLRRLEVKEQMQLHPERTLELSRVLDLMDEEHAAILSNAPGSAVKSAHVQDVSLDPVTDPRPSIQEVAGKFDLQLRVMAGGAESLLRLLEMAVYELQGKIDAEGTKVSGGNSRYIGSMAGTLGDYHFELSIKDETGHE